MIVIQFVHQLLLRRGQVIVAIVLKHLHMFLRCRYFPDLSIICRSSHRLAHPFLAPVPVRSALSALSDSSSSFPPCNCFAHSSRLVCWTSNAPLLLLPGPKPYKKPALSMPGCHTLLFLRGQEGIELRLARKPESAGPSSTGTPVFMIPRAPSMLLSRVNCLRSPCSIWLLRCSSREQGAKMVDQTAQLKYWLTRGRGLWNEQTMDSLEIV